MIDKIITWLIPITCIVCGFTSKTNLCHYCLSELPFLPYCCLTCAEEVQPLITQCGICLIDPPLFSLSVILFHYLPPIPSLITQLKFNQKLRYAYPLGALLAKRVVEVYKNLSLPFPECIIPVPLHNSRLRKRGYNQAMEIARPIKKRLGIPIDSTSAKRHLATAPQTLLSAEDRQLNLKNAFTLRQGFNKKHVALVDDVVTTFSTINELTRVLLDNGVQRVDIWCVAKAAKK